MGTAVSPRHRHCPTASSPKTAIPEERDHASGSPADHLLAVLGTVAKMRQAEFVSLARGRDVASTFADGRDCGCVFGEHIFLTSWRSSQGARDRASLLRSTHSFQRLSLFSGSSDGTEFLTLPRRWFSVRG